MRINVECFGVGFLAGAICMGGAGWYWYARQPTRVKTLVGPTKVVTIKERVFVGQKSTRVLPKSVKRDTHAHVVAGTTIHHRQVTAVVNDLSGVTSLYVQPRSFFSTGRRTTIAVYEGVLGTVGLAPRVDTRVEGTERLFRVGSVHLDGQAAYDTVGGYFVGVGLSYRFGG